MKTTGIIAEYNPFHTGHAYHIQQAKQVTNADYVVVVMSPDFVQRGEPAIFEKYTRTEMALKNGADLVLELPVCYATGSAEYFAEGAAALLNGIGVVDVLCFGSETPELSLYSLSADLLLEEPDDYSKRLKKLLKQGRTFPQARAVALSEYLIGHNSSEFTLHSQEKNSGIDLLEQSEMRSAPLPSDELKRSQAVCLSDFLEKPNNILGVEYCKALKKMHSPIIPLPIQRKGNAFHSPSLSGLYCSASALRQSIGDENGSDIEQQLSYIPESCHTLFQNACLFRLVSDDFLPYLIQQLLTRTEFHDIFDLSEELSERLVRLRFSCIGKSYSEITALLKTRQMTEARIRRALLHLVLGITANSVEAFRANRTVTYARVLGFRKEAAPLLHAIKQNSSIPLLTKNAAAAGLLDDTGKQMLTQDFYASHLYRSVQACKYKMPFRTEYECSPKIIG